jgi:hypothetical protein
LSSCESIIVSRPLGLKFPKFMASEPVVQSSRA